MDQEFLNKHSIAHLYIYHEIPVNKTTVEFGWIEAEEIPMDEPLVMSKSSSNSEINNLVTLGDYVKFFNHLTSTNAEEFISRWAPSPRELEVHWKSNFPQGEADQHLFIMNLAYLIRDRKPFEMYDRTYEVITIEAKDESAGDKEAEISEEVAGGDQPTG